MNRRSGWVVAFALVAACAGEGSDIGPVLPRLPSASCKVVVLDDQGRGVVGARATVAGASALTARSGRGDLFADPRGRVVVQVDGAAGAAVAGDHLGSVRFAATVLGPDLPAAVHLPDLPDSSSAVVTAGMPASSTVITSSAGARLTIPAGATVAAPNGAATVRLGVGDLQPAHVPGDLPVPVGGGALLTGRVVCIDPPETTFAPAVDLDVLDDLNLGATTAALFELDPATGEWTEIRTGLAVVAGRIVATGAITRGGTYVFGREVANASVTGRVVDGLGGVVPGALVAVDGRDAVTDSAGRFTVLGVPGVDASGAGRTAVVEVFAGGIFLPARLATSIAVTAGASVDTGDLVLDTTPAANVRVLQIRRGRAAPLRATRLSTVFGDTAFVSFSDAQGQTTFEDVPAQWIGFQDGRPLDSVTVDYGQSILFVDPGRRWQDYPQFLDDRPWVIGSRRSRAFLCDAVGGGPVFGGRLVVGAVSGAGFIGITQEAGTFFVDRDFDGRALASVRTARDGHAIVSAVSIDRPNGEHVELPLRRVLRTPFGSFDRHGLVSGVLQGVDPARVHALRTTRRLELQEWWDDVVEGQPIRSSLPIDVDPAVTHGAFTVGVDRAGGNLAAVELANTAGVFTLQKAGIVAEFVPVEGASQTRDIALDLPASAMFTVPQGVANLDASISVGSLRCALALEQPTNRVVDVVRGLGGNHAATGGDLVLHLPALAGQLGGHRWRVLVHGAGTALGGTVTQRSLLSLRGDGAESAAPMLSPPVVTAPAAGATVSANGFVVQFTLPADVLYATLELRGQAGSDDLLWQVLVPPNATSYEFQMMPSDTPTPLLAGQTYTLTLSAFRASGGPLRGAPDAYDKITTFLQSIGTIGRGVDSMASHTITIFSS